MGHPIVTSLNPGAAVANGISLVQAPGSGAILLNGSLVSGGVATMDVARQVAIQSSGNDAAITFTVTGTTGPEQGNKTISETIAGTNAGTAVTTQGFLTVTSIKESAAVAANVTIGTNGTVFGPWVPWDRNVRTKFEVSFAGQVTSGTPTWQVDYTFDDVYGTWLPPGVPFPRALTVPGTIGLTAEYDAAIDTPICASRLTLTAVGGVQLTQIQQGD